MHISEVPHKIVLIDELLDNGKTMQETRLCSDPSISRRCQRWLSISKVTYRSSFYLLLNTNWYKAFNLGSKPISNA